jgi:hypothetical protein
LRLSSPSTAEQEETSELKLRASSIEGSLGQFSYRRKSSAPLLVKDDINQKERLTVSADTSPQRRRFKSQSPSTQEAKGVVFRHSKEVLPAAIPRTSSPVERLSISTGILEKIGRRKERMKSVYNLQKLRDLIFLEW